MRKAVIKQFNVVIFWFMNDWGKYGRAYEKIAEYLAKQEAIRQVVCLFPPTRIRGVFRFSPFLFKKINKKLMVLNANERIIPRISGLEPIANQLNDFLIPNSIGLFFKIKAIYKSNTILWVFPPHPYIPNIVKYIPHRVLLTQVVDNNIFKIDYSEEKKEFVKKQYEGLAKNSDIVITSSKLNHDLFSRWNSSCHLFENAVDPVFLGAPTDFPYLEEGKRPRLGYAGYISQRTDMDLLVYLAKMKPEYDLILAGPVEISAEEFSKVMLPNVHYEGVIPYEKMPAFLKSLDICLIPHRDSQFSRSMSPLKMFQYMASGRPIVSTNVAGVDRWGGMIKIADNYDEFVSKIDETIRNDTIEQSSKRVEAARSETWDKRVKGMLEMIIASTN